MALTFKVNTFFSGSPVGSNPDVWNFATAEFDAWITAVNANPSNTNRQVTKLRDLSNSTVTGYGGWVYQLGHPTLPDIISRFYTRGGGTIYIESATVNEWTDDTSSGGYGAIALPYFNTTASFYSNDDGINYVVTNDIDGEEFFISGWYIYGTTYISHVIIFKDTHGEWVSMPAGNNSNSSRIVPAAAAFNDTGIYNPFYCVSCYNAASSQMGKLVPNLIYNSTAAGENRIANKLALQAASPLLGACNTTIALTPFYSAESGKDWVSCGHLHAVDMTGFI